MQNLHGHPHNFDMILFTIYKLINLSLYIIYIELYVSQFLYLSRINSADGYTCNVLMISYYLVKYFLIKL